MTVDAAVSGTFTIGGDLEVNRLGYGAMRITGDGVWGPPPDHDGAIAVLKRAIELGIDFIDTADSYGPYVSEELIAEALHPYPDGLVIATKGGLERTGPDEWPRNGRPEHLKAACEGSLRRLKVDRIDLYQLHAPDPDVPYADSVGALKELQDEGKIKHVGVSNVSVEQLAEARSIVEVVSVQNRYSLSDRDSQDVLDVCEADELAFIPWYPLAAGDLARPGGPLARAAQRHDATPSQVAIAWLLHRAPNILPIPGTKSVEHLEENVAAAALRLDEDELRELDEAA
jgi:aryl-alcohol dehydrogenase-like predicted oxidoreductase